jgi:hypothetical protein
MAPWRSILQVSVFGPAFRAAAEKAAQKAGFRPECTSVYQIWDSGSNELPPAEEPNMDAAAPDCMEKRLRLCDGLVAPAPARSVLLPHGMRSLKNHGNVIRVKFPCHTKTAGFPAVWLHGLQLF